MNDKNSNINDKFDSCFDKLHFLNKNKLSCEKSSCANKNCKFNFNSLESRCALAELLKEENQSMTLQSIGDLFDLSRMRICQLEKLIIDKLKF
jgi:DNA-directed RNA polymerase sigma subunit (sigma70/sigma32)